MAEEKAHSLRIHLWFEFWFCCFEVLLNHLTLLGGLSCLVSIQWEEHLFPARLLGRTQDYIEKASRTVLGWLLKLKKRAAKN